MPPARIPISICVDGGCVGSTKGPNTARKNTRTFGFTMAIEKPAMNPPRVVRPSGRGDFPAVTSWYPKNTSNPMPRSVRADVSFGIAIRSADSPKTVINANAVIPSPWPSAPLIPTRVPFDADIERINSQESPGEAATARQRRANLSQSASVISVLDGGPRAAFQYSIPDHEWCRAYRVASSREPDQS